MKLRRFLTAGLASPVLAVAFSMSGGAAAAAPPAATAPSLGAASSFAILGGPAVTCTGSTLEVTVTGNVGAGFTGAPVTQTLCVVTGTVHQGDVAAAQAYNDFVLAYIALGAKPCGPVLTGTLADVTLAPGVYCFAAAATLTGVLTLDAQGDPNAVWIFKVGTGGTGALTGTNFSVNMINGGQPCNVYWRVADGVTMTTSDFVGTILAGAAITFTGDTSAPGTFTGRALAKAAVTITDMNVTNTCGAAGPGPVPCKASRDWVTGKGYIKLPSGAQGSFRISAELRNGAFKGYLEYSANGQHKDHSGTGVTVKGTSITQYLVVNATTRHIEGTAKFNGVAGFTFKVDVSDNGRSGWRANDTFSISVFDASGALVYSASGKVQGGNISLHKGTACPKVHPCD